MNIKLLAIGGFVSLLGLAAGYPYLYRVYLSEGTKAVLKQMDYKSAIEGFALCQIHNYSTANMPHDQCLDFFNNYVPAVFEKSKDETFPLNFTKKSDLVKTYNLVQKDLREFGLEELPPLRVLTNGKVQS
ncbi:hypothetical protein [Lacimicrobium sp. SS2-24]|uniref:hypothetical protein n=1 Tax=Lacimicrobium sp. SS2-24 TaxID=2005569 RepID=UPI000B4BEC7A|nr:hypothetical protein [Lacimicrobium sp. SS2-24]